MVEDADPSPWMSALRMLAAASFMAASVTGIAGLWPQSNPRAFLEFLFLTNGVVVTALSAAFGFPSLLATLSRWMSRPAGLAACILVSIGMLLWTLPAAIRAGQIAVLERHPDPHNTMNPGNCQVVAWCEPPPAARSCRIIIQTLRSGSEERIRTLTYILIRESQSAAGWKPFYLGDEAHEQYLVRLEPVPQSEEDYEAWAKFQDCAGETDVERDAARASCSPPLLDGPVAIVVRNPANMHGRDQGRQVGIAQFEVSADPGDFSADH